MNQFCFNPQVITRRYKMVFESLLHHIDNQRVQLLLKKDLDEFVKQVHSMYVSYYNNETSVRPNFDERNAVVLKKNIKPALDRIEQKLRAATPYLVIKKRKRTALVGGSNGDVYLFVAANHETTYPVIFNQDYKFAFQKNWKWWQILLLVPIFDALVDLGMMIVQGALMCFASWYCGLALVGLFIAMRGGGGDYISTDKFPYFVAMIMVSKGMSVKDVLKFLNNYHKPVTTLSALTTLIGVAICRPSQKEIQDNVASFVKELKGYTYRGDHPLVTTFIHAMQTAHGQSLRLEHQPSEQQLRDQVAHIAQDMKNDFKKAVSG